MQRRTLMTIAAGALTLFASPVLAQEVTLKLHQFLPPQANVPKLILDLWADKVEEASGGRIKIEHFDAMALGGRPPRADGPGASTAWSTSSGPWSAIRPAAFRAPRSSNCPS